MDILALPEKFEIWAAETALAPYVRLAKSEAKKTLKAVGINPQSIKEDFKKIMEGKDLVIETFQDATQFGFEQTFGPFLQTTGNIIKKTKGYLNPSDTFVGDTPTMKNIENIKKLGVPVSLIITNPSELNEQPRQMYPSQRYPIQMGGRQKEKEPIEEIEDLLGMIVNHKQWLSKQAYNIHKTNINKKKINKKKIKREKMKKNKKTNSKKKKIIRIKKGKTKKIKGRK